MSLKALELRIELGIVNTKMALLNTEEVLIAHNYNPASVFLLKPKVDILRQQLKHFQNALQRVQQMEKNYG